MQSDIYIGHVSIHNHSRQTTSSQFVQFTFVLSLDAMLIDFITTSYMMLYALLLLIPYLVQVSWRIFLLFLQYSFVSCECVHFLPFKTTLSRVAITVCDLISFHGLSLKISGNKKPEKKTRNKWISQSQSHQKCHSKKALFAQINYNR